MMRPLAALAGFFFMLFVAGAPLQAQTCTITPTATINFGTVDVLLNAAVGGLLAIRADGAYGGYAMRVGFSSAVHTAQGNELVPSAFG